MPLQLLLLRLLLLWCSCIGRHGCIVVPMCYHAWRSLLLLLLVGEAIAVTSCHELLLLLRRHLLRRHRWLRRLSQLDHCTLRQLLAAVGGRGWGVQCDAGCCSGCWHCWR